MRWVVLAGMTGSVVVAYLTRAAPGARWLVDQERAALSNTGLGEILGVWAAGYIGFQLPGGWLGDRWGRRAVAADLRLVWSLCTLATAGAASFAEHVVVAADFRHGPSRADPLLTRACMDWFPQDSRGSASAAITAGMSVGAVGASGLSAVMLPLLGWRITLDLFALVGVAWAVWFWITFRDRPEQHPRVNAAEIALIRKPAAPPTENSESSPTGQPAPPIGQREQARWVDGLGVYWSRAFMMLNAQAVCRAFCYAFLISWFPSYSSVPHGLRLANASVMTMLPLAGVVAGAMVGGALIDRVLRRTGSKWLSRSLVAAAALVLAGLGPLVAIKAVHPAVAWRRSGWGPPSRDWPRRPPGRQPWTWEANRPRRSWRSSICPETSAHMLCPKAVGVILDAYPEALGPGALHVRDGLDHGRNLLAAGESRPARVSST